MSSIRATTTELELPGSAWDSGRLGAGRLPFDWVLGLDRPRSSRLGTYVALAFVAHAVVGATIDGDDTTVRTSVRAMRARVVASLTQTIDIEPLERPEEPPEPESAPLPEAPKERALPPPPKEAPAPPKEAAPKEAPPPAAAQAGAVLTQESKEDEPVDLTNTFVTGTSEQFAGGVTQRGGTSDTAVRDANARAGGVPGGTGNAIAAAPPPTVDMSRAASCGKNTDWNCPFPPEADTAQVDEASVLLRVTVNTDGTIAKVEVTQDPGYGFGREARRCALQQRCDPALDRTGRPMAGQTKLIRVSFSR
jgi:protein TonB